MTGILILLTAFAGGVGSALRYLVDTKITSKVSTSYPWGTTVVNVTGSLLLGILTGVGLTLLPELWVTVLGTGLIGGYTTFSTASIETVRLLLQRRHLSGLTNAFGGLVVCVTVAYAGLLIGQQLT
jgi:CrcB protein